MSAIDEVLKNAAVRVAMEMEQYRAKIKSYEREVDELLNIRIGKDETIAALKSQLSESHDLTFLLQKQLEQVKDLAQKDLEQSIAYSKSLSEETHKYRQLWEVADARNCEQRMKIDDLELEVQKLYAEGRGKPANAQLLEAAELKETMYRPQLILRENPAGILTLIDKYGIPVMRYDTGDGFKTGGCIGENYRHILEYCEKLNHDLTIEDESLIEKLGVRSNPTIWSFR